ncbi:MAG: fatty acid cis/trans isomerase [Bdellovibrionales bacterium]|nr:fatty acid cis/trans isomerase [Bdellovibrionales bacterium]
MRTRTSRVLLCLAVLSLLGGCAVALRHALDQKYGEPQVRSRVLASTTGPSFYREIKPVLDRRCVVCHACYDAPCQLKLGSIEGIDRGASKSPVYHSDRLIAADPSRLYIDGQNTSEWRTRDFFPVLNEREQTPEANLIASVFYRTLLLKDKHPLPESPQLPDSFNFGIDSEWECPTIEEFDAFEKDYPLWGMPYGLPSLSTNERGLLASWISSGAQTPERAALSELHMKRIAKWEKFFNGNTAKEKLMSRYIYEHLFLAHLYFDDLAPGEFFKLVRSKTPPGSPIEIIPTRRPYDSPGKEPFYYRLWRERSSISIKTHMPYGLNMRRLKFWQELFIEPDYPVDELPKYSANIAANPFKSFSQIPVNSRYRFLLDEAEFTIMNFIKGPVCRGNTALNVINDRFWILFVNPDLPQLRHEDEFLAKNSKDLQLPSAEESNALVLTNWLRYSKLSQEYTAARNQYLEKIFPDPGVVDMNVIWNGDRSNTNSALTVFRHYDSATVVRGLVGETPKTAWLLSYTLLERIHYLLVAGFDVFGNVGHQLNSRLYMDFLRMEAESNFLMLLPPATRETELHYWYRDAQSHVEEYIAWPDNLSKRPVGIDYKTSNPKQELFDLAKARLKRALSKKYDLNDSKKSSDAELRSLQGLQSEGVQFFPELSFLRVSNGPRSEFFTLIRDASYSNVTTPFFEEDRRRPKEDSLTLVRGFLGAYPNAFFDIARSELKEFVKGVAEVRDEPGYLRLRERFGVRRSSADFWQFADSIHDAQQREDAVQAGLFDFNRLENR